MENYQIGLLITFFLGIFILIGAFIGLLVEDKKKIEEFSIGLAFGVIVTLIITDLIPEIFEALKFSKIYLFIIFGIIGYVLLKLLDTLIPDHHEHKMNKHEKEQNLTHIGVVTSLALVLHNIIEGMAVYSSCLSGTNVGIALMLGVGFHNIPLGMVISSSLYHNNKNKLKTTISILLVSLSTFVGGLIMFIFKLTEISEIVEGILLSVTLGMLVFIVIDELLPRILSVKKKKNVTYGIVIGVIILLISLLF